MVIGVDKDDGESGGSTSHGGHEEREAVLLLEVVDPNMWKRGLGRGQTDPVNVRDFLSEWTRDILKSNSTPITPAFTCRPTWKKAHNDRIIVNREPRSRHVAGEG